MKRKTILWVMLAILGVWAAGAGLARAEKAADASKDKTSTKDKTTTDKSDDDGGLDVDWGDDDEKGKDKSSTSTKPASTQPTDTQPADTQPADKEKTSATDEDKDDDAKDKNDDDGDEKGEKEKEVVVLESLEGFYADLARSVEMPDDQQRKLETIQDKMKKHLEFQEKKDAPEVERLEKKLAKSEDEKRKKKVQADIDKIQAKLKMIEDGYHQQAMKLLKGDQIPKWNEALLWTKVEPDMTMLSISEEQRKKAKVICAEIVAKSKSKPLPESAAAKLKITAAKKIIKDVLDAGQSKEYKRYLVEQMQAGRDAASEEKGSKKTTKGSRDK